MSEAFRLIETGGDPRSHLALDYSVLLPLLLSRLGLEAAPFLSRYAQTGTVLRYLDLNYRSIQRQVKEELQLEKQQIGSSGDSKAGLFESGTAEERARIVLAELARLEQRERDYVPQVNKAGSRTDKHTLLDNQVFRQEIAIIVVVLVLRCRHPLIGIQSLVQSLRAVRDPGSLIYAIVANNPTEFSPTIDTLLDSDDRYSNVKDILPRLCKLADYRTWDVRQRLVDRKVFPNLAIELTIEHCHDEIGFMNRILKGQPEWLTNSQGPVTRTSMTSIMEFVFSSLNDELISDRPDNVAVNRLLRILSGMVGLMSLSLTAEQLEISLGVLEMAPAEPCTVNFKVCLILMSAAQLLKYSEPRTRRILRTLLDCADSPQVLLLWIYFQSKLLPKIDEFASRALSMEIVVPRSGLMDLSTFFTTLFTDEELASCALGLGRPSSSSPYKTNGSSAAPTSATPSTTIVSSTEASEIRSISNFCVSHLLDRGVFIRSSTDVRTWVLDQIQATNVPLDDNMIPLLQAYTKAISKSDRITRIPEHDIRTFFANPCQDLTPAKVLLTLYMLLNNEVCLETLGLDSANRNREYDATLLQYVQIRKVLLFVQEFQRGVAFKAVQPMFLKLINSQFPELFDVSTLLLEEEKRFTSSAASQVSYSSHRKASGSPFTPLISTPHTTSTESSAWVETHYKALEQHLLYPEDAIKAYYAFQRLPQADRQMLAGSIVQMSLPSLLDPESDPTVMEVFKKTWDQLNTIMPHDLWAMTVDTLLPRSSNSFLPPHLLTTTTASQGGSGSVANQLFNQAPFHQQKNKDVYTFEWLVQDPLLLFKVDPRVFRTPTIFRMFIQILGAVLVGSRHWYRKHFNSSQAVLNSHQNMIPIQSQKHRVFKESNLTALIYIQDSSVIQFLFEICQRRPEDIEEALAQEEAATVAAAATSGNYLDDDFSGHPRTKENRKNSTAGQRKPVSHGKEHLQGPISDVLREIQIVTFNFLHQLFIDIKILPKLVHFQGYSPELLPATIAGMESLHATTDYLQELLYSTPAAATSVVLPGVGTPVTSSTGAMLAGGPGPGSLSSPTGPIVVDGAVGALGAISVAGIGAGGLNPVAAAAASTPSDLTLHLFALRLSVLVCEKYPLVRTKDMAEGFILERIGYLAVSSNFSQEVLDSAKILARAFPSLHGQIIGTLQEAYGLERQRELDGFIESVRQMALDPVLWNKTLL
ncbi:Integrator complex subunit 2 [Mortierella sp. AD032]|nr:Integrator complex subunit 2 [Mortierella sp. AD032]